MTYTILVVEDQAHERESLLRFLRANDYIAYGSPTAEAAMAHLDEVVDLVLTDVRMGAMSGIDLLHAWKRVKPATPFILLTAFGEIPAAVEAVKGGADDYLVKPVHPTTLLERIAASLANTEHIAPTYTGMPLDQIERSVIEKTLSECNGNRTRTAQQLGISVRTLQRKLRAWSAEQASAT
jgi:DNA-binding NtrC family response regulator